MPSIDRIFRTFSPSFVFIGSLKRRWNPCGYSGDAISNARSIGATQDINDYFALEDGKYGKGIINNSKTKIVLNLEDEEAQRVQSILRLSETEVMAITHFERGNGLISTNNNNVTVEMKSSRLELELITTDRRELKEIMEKKKTKAESVRKSEAKP